MCTDRPSKHAILCTHIHIYVCMYHLSIMYHHLSFYIHLSIHQKAQIYTDTSDSNPVQQCSFYPSLFPWLYYIYLIGKISVFLKIQTYLFKIWFSKVNLGSLYLLYSYVVMLFISYTARLIYYSMYSILHSPH